MDSDWATCQVYAADTTNGEVIYMGDSEFYDCAMKLVANPCHGSFAMGDKIRYDKIGTNL